MPDRYGNPTNEEIKAMQAKTIANRRAQHAAQVAAAAPAKARGLRDLQELEASRRRAEMERNKQLAIRESEKRNLDRRRAEARAAAAANAAEQRRSTPPPVQPPPIQPPPLQPAPVVAATTAAALQKPPADFGYDPDRPGVPREALDDLEKQIRGEPQQAPGVSGFPGQAQAGTTTQQKPPMTAEDLGIQRDKALLAAKEAQQKLNNPNVSTPSNVQAEQERLSNFQTEMEQPGTLGGGVAMPESGAAIPGPTGPTPVQEPPRRVPPEMEQNLDGTLSEAQRSAMRERLQSAMAEAQQQKTLGGGIDRGAPSIGSVGKKFPGDPSDIQGIPVADATRDAMRPRAYGQSVVRPAGKPVSVAVEGGGMREVVSTSGGKYGTYGTMSLRELYNQTGRLNWDEFHALTQDAQGAYLSQLETQLRPFEFQAKLDELRGQKPVTTVPTPVESVQRDRTQRRDVQTRAEEAADRHSREELQEASVSGIYAAQNLGITPEIAQAALQILGGRTRASDRDAQGRTWDNIWDSERYRSGARARQEMDTVYTGGDY